MPTYAYACTACDHRFEIIQSFTEDSLSQCPQCEGRLRKLFNAVGVVFKGAGFYRTDSRAGSSATVPASSGDSGAKATSSSSSTDSASTSSKGSSASTGSTASSSSAAGGSAA